MDLIGRHKNTGKQTDRQISRQAKTHAGRQAERQTGIQSICLSVKAVGPERHRPWRALTAEGEEWKKSH